MKLLGSIFLVIALSASGQVVGQTEERLPDGEFATISVNGMQISAWYGSPTTRYRHGILGDAIEAGSLHLRIGDRDVQSFHLPKTEVFEDRTPRLVDLNGDGSIEIITIRSYLDAGGSVAIFGLQNGKLAELASSKSVGRANRWLNIAGIADYAGTGSSQIAYVETPHIGGTLYFLEWRGSELVPIASMPRFSNHKIGSREQALTSSLDFTGNGKPDLVVPSDNLRALRIVGFEDGALKEFKRIKLPASVLKSQSGSAENQQCATFKMTNGQTLEICPVGDR
ncbi:MAG: hypothetical protein ABJL55_12725 [Roseibium sp.]